MTQSNYLCNMTPSFDRYRMVSGITTVRFKGVDNCLSFSPFLADWFMSMTVNGIDDVTTHDRIYSNKHQISNASWEYFLL